MMDPEEFATDERSFDASRHICTPPRVDDAMPSSQPLSSQRVKTQVKYAALVQQRKPPSRRVPDARSGKALTKGTKTTANATSASAKASKSALTKNAKVPGKTLKKQDLSLLILEDAIEIFFARTRESSRPLGKDLRDMGFIPLEPSVKPTNAKDLPQTAETAKSHSKQTMKPIEQISCDETNKSISEISKDNTATTKRRIFASIREKFRSSRIPPSSQSTTDAKQITNSSVTPDSSMLLDGKGPATQTNDASDLPPTSTINVQESNKEKKVEGEHAVVNESRGHPTLEITCHRDDQESTEQVETIVHDEVREPCDNEETATKDEGNAGLESHLPPCKDIPDVVSNPVVATPIAPKIETNVVVCNHCKELIGEGERHLKEYPYTYADKSLIVIYHHACYQARKNIEMEKLEVDKEFMNICKTLRTAKSKSKKAAIHRGNKMNQSILRSEPNPKPRPHAAPPERVDSLDELVYAVTAGESSERSSRHKSQRGKSPKHHPRGQPRSEWSFDESPSYSSRDYDISSSDDDASHLDYDSDGVNTTGGEKGNRQLHRAVRRGRSATPQDRRRERSRSASKYHSPRGRSQARSQKSTRSRSLHRLEDRPGQSRSGRRATSPTYRRTRDYDHDEEEHYDRLHIDRDADDVASVESRDSFHERSSRRRPASPLPRRNGREVHDYDTSSSNRRGRSPEKKQRSNRGDHQSASTRLNAAKGSKWKETGSSRGDDRFLGQGMSPLSKGASTPSSPRQSIVDRLKEGTVSTNTGSQRTSRATAAMATSGNKGTSQSERASRTVMSRGIHDTVRGESRSLRSERTSTLGGKEEMNRTTTSTTTRPSRTSGAVKSNKETTGSQRSSRSSGLVRNKQMSEPKNQQAMTKMFGKPKVAIPVASNKAKPMVVRKRPKTRVSAE